MSFAANLHHQIVEAAKVQFRADGNDLPFDECLETQAAAIVPAGVDYQITTKNGVWHLIIID